MKSAVISWTNYQRNTELWAHHLGASLHFICRGRQGNLLQAPVRYVLQAQDTWRILLAERPDLVLVQNPPIFTALLASLYARRYGARYIIDSHTGAFLSPKWRWALGLHRWLSRQAVTTIVTNEHLQSVVNGWGAHSQVVRLIPGHYPEGSPFPFTGVFNVAVPALFDWDEPIAEIFDAARWLGDVHFYVTGNSQRLDPTLLSRKPANCHLTGWIPDEQYVGLLRSANAVLDLTKQDHTLLQGAYEAVSLGTPLVVSDWPILRQYFSRGTVHISNSAEAICAAVRRVQVEEDDLRREIAALRDELNAQWEVTLGEMKQLLARN